MPSHEPTPLYRQDGGVFADNKLAKQSAAEQSEAKQKTKTTKQAAAEDKAAAAVEDAIPAETTKEEATVQIWPGLATVTVPRRPAGRRLGSACEPQAAPLNPDIALRPKCRLWCEPSGLPALTLAARGCVPSFGDEGSSRPYSTRC